MLLAATDYCCYFLFTTTILYHVHTTVFSPPKAQQTSRTFFSTIVRLPKEINFMMKEGKVSKLFGSIISQVAVDAPCLPMPAYALLTLHTSAVPSSVNK